MPDPESRLASDNTSVGGLSVSAVSFSGNRPIPNAIIEIAYSNAPENIIEVLRTDENGQTGIVELDAPDIEFSLDPDNEQRPYATLNLRITCDGYETIEVNEVQLLPEVVARQNFVLVPLPENPEYDGSIESFNIGPNVLYGDYPPHITEDEVKPLSESGEVVLDSVVIPEYIIVHDGAPRAQATNYWVKYKDYIKNVASSEIYATWPTAAIYANILAIQSFTLNRVYTEW